MDTQIVGAVIGAVGVLLAAFVGVWGRSKAKKADKMAEKANAVERQVEDVSKGLQEESLKRYGFKADLVISKAEIIDLKGTVKLSRSFRGVRIVQPEVVLADIPGSVWVDCPDGEIIEFPEFVTPINFPKAITLDKRCEQKRCEFRVRVTGALTHSDPPLDYELQTTYSKGICMTKEEMDEAYKNDVFKMEYHSFDVDIPMDVLELDVAFPQGYTVQTFPGVLFGKGGYIHNSELQRVASGFTSRPLGAHFRINDPLLGFRYLIYWVALSQKEFDELKQKV